MEGNNFVGGNLWIVLTSSVEECRGDMKRSMMDSNKMNVVDIVYKQS